jgi:Mrp family chromosome partitioning ATPase
MSNKKPQKEPLSPQPKDNIKYVLAVMSGKGGVGKSSVAGLLACSMQRRGGNYACGIIQRDKTYVDQFVVTQG